MKKTYRRSVLERQNVTPRRIPQPEPAPSRIALDLALIALAAAALIAAWLGA